MSKINLMKLSPTIMFNSDLFKISYTPEEITERKETELVYKELAPFVTYKRPNHVLIVGDPGTGKTVTARYIQKNMPSIDNSIEVIYVNCDGKDASQVLHLMNSGSQKTGIEFDYALDYFLKERINKNTLIILDEVDKGEKLYSLLYALSRPSETSLDFRFNINLLLISNDMHWEETLLPHIRSSLQLRKVAFKHYEANQLKEILMNRIQQGFLENTIEEKLVDKIVEETINERKADCRVAINTLFLSAKNAEEKGKTRIEEKDVEGAFQEAIYSVEMKRVSSLNLTQFAVLLSCYSKVEGLQELYDEYSKIHEDTMPPKWKGGKIQKTKYHHQLDYLNSLGLIKKNNMIKKQEGSPPVRVLKVKPTISIKVIKNEIKKRTNVRS